MLSRFFCEKGVRENFCNSHHIVSGTQCGNCCAFVSHIFGKNFVKVMFLLKKLLELIWRIFLFFFLVRLNFSLFHTVRYILSKKLLKFTATVFSQKFRQINVLQGIFRFSPLCGNYGTQCGLCKNEKFTATNIFFRQFNFYFSLVEQLIWRNFAAVKVCNFWILKCAEFSSGTIIW